METNCQFSEPQIFDGSIPTNTDQIFNFSKADCSTTDETLALIQNPTTSTEFYLSQTISYGDFLVISFLILFLVLGITKFLIDWFIPKRMNFQR